MEKLVAKLFVQHHPTSSKIGDTALLWTILGEKCLVVKPWVENTTMNRKKSWFSAEINQ